MKQFIVGLTCGAILMATGSAFAAGGLVGKEVQKEVSVQLNGAEVSSGVIIDGSTYAPVRNISEAVGLDVSYTQGVVTLTSEEETGSIDYTIPEITPEPQVDTSDPYWMYDTVEKIESRIATIESGIERKQSEIDAQQQAVDRFEAYLNDNPDDINMASMQSEIEVRKKVIEQTNDSISLSRAEIEALQAKLAKLAAE